MMVLLFVVIDVIAIFSRINLMITLNLSLCGFYKHNTQVPTIYMCSRVPRQVQSIIISQNILFSYGNSKS